jgi:MoxR-like ATPase
MPNEEEIGVVPPSLANRAVKTTLETMVEQTAGWDDDAPMTCLDTIRVVEAVDGAYVERHEIVTALVACVIARHHAVLIGPTGTAKTSLIRDLAAGLGGLRFFSWQLTEFSVPEELFGPIDVAAMADQTEPLFRVLSAFFDLKDPVVAERIAQGLTGCYRRITTGKLPEAELAFVDEVFKAGPAILNTLLSIMQERLFYNDGRPTPVPLISLIGASNETPTGVQELEALWDRFMVRLLVGYVQEPGNFVQMLTGRVGTVGQILSSADLQAAQGAAAKVAVPGSVHDMVARLRQALSDQGIVASDRRYKESIDLLRAVAFLDGRHQVAEDDLLFLQHVLWHDPAQAGEVARLVFAVAEPLLVGIAELEDEALVAINKARRTLAAGTPDAASSQKLLEAVTVFREVLKKLEDLEEQATGRPKAAEALAKTHGRVKGWQAEILKALGV